MYDELQKLKTNFLETQRILRFFDQERNVFAYRRLPEEDQKLINEYILSRNFEGIKNILNDRLDLARRPMEYLRTLAKSMCINKYTLLTRRQLIDAIANYQDSHPTNP